jgi:hypothetical protein
MKEMMKEKTTRCGQGGTGRYGEEQRGRKRQKGKEKEKEKEKRWATAPHLGRASTTAQGTENG